MYQCVCDFCGSIAQKPDSFGMGKRIDMYNWTYNYDMCEHCEPIVSHMSETFIDEVKKQCQKAKAEKESRDF